MEAVLKHGGFDVVSLLPFLERDGFDLSSRLGFLYLLFVDVSPDYSPFLGLDLEFPFVGFDGDCIGYLSCLLVCDFKRIVVVLI
jgi:hypothetical protein